MEAIVRAKCTEDSNYSRQIAWLKVTGRRFTGVGFFSDFALDEPSNATRSNRPQEAMSAWVHLETPGLRHGGGFVLFAENGILSMLEGFSYDKPWPGMIDRYELLCSSKLAEKR